jgi:hypothetical protein
VSFGTLKTALFSYEKWVYFFEVKFNLKNSISNLGSVAHLPKVGSKNNYSLSFNRWVCHTAEGKELVLIL